MGLNLSANSLKQFWQQYRLPILTLVLVIAFLSGLYFWQQTHRPTFSAGQYLSHLTQQFTNQQPTSTTAPSPTPTPTPTPTPKPLPHGIQIYNFSHGKNVLGPKPTKVVINPLDPKLNRYQSLAITIKNPQPVTSAQIVLVTDNYSRTIPLKLKSGSLTDGIWVAKYKFTHSYDYTYQIKMLFSDGQQEFHGGLTFR